MDVTSGPNNEATHLRPADDETIYDGLIAQEVEAIDEAGVNGADGLKMNPTESRSSIRSFNNSSYQSGSEQQETINSLKK